MDFASRVVRAVLNRVPAHAVDRAAAALLPLRSFERLELPAESALTIVCDDGESRDLEIVELLDRAGAKGVFAVSPDLIGRPGFLGYAELRQVLDAGHEIAFHGATHDPFTGFADEASLRAAIDAGMASLHGRGLGSPRTLIYPYGSNSRWVREAVAKTFDCAFTTWYGINRGKVNRFALQRVPFGAYTGKLPATEAWYRGLVDQAAGGAAWPVLMLHPADRQHTADHTALLGRLIEYARSRGVAVRTVAAHLRRSAPESTANSRADVLAKQHGPIPPESGRRPV
jgi:peptidoglycan/xylan/chitin deacetylase (PgdA/CDA1 family)